MIRKKGGGSKAERVVTGFKGQEKRVCASG